jgi:hypothetical protein
MNKKHLMLSFLILVFSSFGYATTPSRTELAVWANEAIIATYTFNYNNVVTEQKKIAQYFTAKGWIAYSQALTDSKLLDTVKEQSYEVTAVATQPPILVTLDPTHWQATMSILVVYKNPQHQQQQNLKIKIEFSPAPAGQGVRGLSILSLQATPIDAPCQCNAEPKPSES